MTRETSPTRTNPNLFLFWRILFDVVSGQVRLRKEFTVWDRTTSKQPVRLHRGIMALGWQAIGNVEIRHDKVEFRDGYLECYDEPVDIKKLFPNLKLSGRAYSEIGDSVCVWAEIKLPSSDTTDTTFPIFYYPQEKITQGAGQPVQNDKYLALTVLEAKGNRNINWTIDQPQFPARPQPPRTYKLSGPDGWHRVRVRQDWDQDPRVPSLKHYFELLVDGVSLENLPIPNDGSFRFSNKQKTFYIGRTPDPDKPGEWMKLTGELQALEFDPNDSCPSCAG